MFWFGHWPSVPPWARGKKAKERRRTALFSNLDDLVEGAQAKTTKYATKYAVKVIFAFNYYNKILKITFCFFEKMYNKIKRELRATDCECFEIKFYTDRLPCFGCQMFKKWPFKLGRKYQTAHQNDGFNALRLCCSKLNPACFSVLWFQTSKTSQGTMSDSTSQPSSRTAKSGKFTIKRSDIHLEVLSLQNRKSFEYFLCFYRTLDISPKDLEGFKADIAFIYTTLACSLWFDFCNAKFHWFLGYQMCLLMVSRKDHCLERVLRKSFLIQKSINKIPFICRINFEKYFIKAIENFFPVFA